ncbi:MAG: endonuclease V [Candidatus Nanohaloarchaea archaeon]
MKPPVKKYRPDPSLTREEMEQLQRELAREAVFDDRFSFDESLEGVTVAGIDQAFLEDKAVSAVVLVRNGKVVERVHGVSELELPYIPGLLAFREGSCIVDALKNLSREPDLLMFDGSGRIHYRQAGIATHIGVMFDLPAIGVAKSLLCGEPAGETGGLEQGEQVAIGAGSEVDAENGETVGYAFQSRTYDSGNASINPLFVSPGHRVSEETAVDLVERCCDGYKLPEPTRLADSYVDEVKQQLEN